MIGKYNKSVILTYVGAALSMAGMAAAVRGRLSAAVICLIYAGICDLFDGAVARRCRRDEEEKAFGVQIDSLADMISFVAFPCVIGCVLLGEAVAAAVPVLILYTLCGIIRLAWFNIHVNDEGRAGCYDGLPVTYAALILPVFYLLEGYIPASVFPAAVCVLYAAVAVLFVVRVRIPKPGGVWYGIFGALAAAVTIAVLMK